MTRHIRWIIVIVVGIAALAVFFYCRFVAALLPEPLRVPLAVEQQWLAGVAVLYIVNFVAARKFKNSYAISAVRMLLFAVIAFALVSHTVDIVAEHSGMLHEIWKTEPAAMQVRARLAAVTASTALCLTAVAVGFESAADSTETVS
jgi:amino acid transporter